MKAKTMRQVRQAKSFSRDYKRIAKSDRYDLDELRGIVAKLERDIPLEPRYREHNLTGDLCGHSECHIRPDWLLIYRRVRNDALILYRTGSHAELYG